MNDSGGTDITITEQGRLLNSTNKDVYVRKWLPQTVSRSHCLGKITVSWQLTDGKPFLALLHWGLRVKDAILILHYEIIIKTLVP